MTRRPRRTIIIGAGLAGSAAAWRLAQRGDDVTLIEAHQPAHAGGSSHGSARIFRHAYEDVFYTGLTARALDGWRELEEASGETLLTTTGGLDFGAGRDIEGIATSLTHFALPHELLSQGEARERFPHIAFDSPAIYQPGAGVIDADRSVRAMIGQAQQHGARVLLDTPVLAATNTTVDLASETLTADIVILTVGAWLPEFVRDKKFPALTVTQQQAFFFDFPPDTAEWPIFVYKDAASIYALPGGTDVNNTGFKIAEHDGNNVTTARQRDGVVDATARARVTHWVETFLPTTDPTITAETTCLYTSTPTEEFVIDRIDGLVIASPCSGHGAKFAPVLGELIADVAHGLPAPTKFQVATHLV